MTNRYPWKENTSQNTADQDDPRYETPGGAANKIEQSLQDSKEYTDARLSLPELPIHNGAIVERHIRDENVSSRTIAQKAVTLNKMADDALSGSNHSYGGRVNANTVTEAIDTLDDRVQYFIDNSGTSVAELLDARLPATGPAFPNVRDRLNKSDEQLAKTADDLRDVLDTDKVSKQVTLTNQDIVNPLTTMLTDSSSRGIRYAYFDKESEVQLSTPLPQKDVLFIGKSWVGKQHENNAFYHISNSLNSFHGKINKNHCKFTQLKAAIAVSRPINVTIWGDSISTNSDLLNANTTSVSSSENSPDGITEGDSYTSFLYDLFADSMPDKTLNFHNRAIGGTRLSEWNDAKTFNSVSKAWVEHIKDTAPDVLIIAFGMNHSTYDRARVFASDLKKITDYINANFAIKPDLVFVSTPRPTYRPENAWGAFQEHASRQITANVLRNNASKYKAYLIDVNRLSNIKRSGTDWELPTYREFDPAPFMAKDKDVNGNYVFTGTTSAVEVAKYMKDFVIKCTVTFSGYAVDGDNLNIRYGRTQVAGFNNNQVQITPNSPTNGNKSLVLSYAKIADYTNWGSSGMSASKILPTSESVFNIRIEKRGSVLEVHREVGGVAQGLLLRDKLEVWDSIGNLVIVHNGITSGATTTISNFRMFEPLYTDYLPELTEKMAWGNFNPSDTGLKTPYGGNGVNHPSSIGIKDMYLPCVEEFVSDIADVYRNS